MKAGLATSAILHAAILAAGLVGAPAPQPFDVVEDSIPVTTITEAELAQLVAGDDRAPAAETPAPRPTETTASVPDARNAGDNTVDLDNAPTPQPAPRAVETAAAPPTQSDPAPVPDPTPSPAPASEPAPVPATEVTPQPQPRQEVRPDPVDEAAAEPTPQPQPDIVLPDTAPVPQSRPQPPRPAQTAKAPERKDSEQPAQEERKTAEVNEIDELLRQTKAVLNRAQPSGGGARRETRQAALGNERTNAPKLTASEMSVLREQLGGCWSIDAGIRDPDKLKVSVRFNLDRDGKLEGMPEVISSSGNPQFDRTAVRAIQKCDLAGLSVPPGKFETWSEVIVHFDPADMFY